MEYSDKLRIQYLLIDEGWHSLRKIKYRICNGQLPWWKRNFIFNPWKKLFYTDVSGNVHYNFTKWYYDNVLKPIRTLGDIKKHIAEQYRLIEEYKDEDEW